MTKHISLIGLVLAVTLAAFPACGGGYMTFGVGYGYVIYDDCTCWMECDCCGCYEICDCYGKTLSEPGAAGPCLEVW